MVTRLYRISHFLWRWHVPLLPWVIKVINRIAFGAVVPPSTRIGRGVLLSYQGLATVIHKDAVIGDKVIISTCVTIGGRSGHKEAPVIEEGAFIGTGAKVLGPVRIGRYASIGANAVVLRDIPPYAVAVGIPAKVVRINRPEDIPRYDEFA